MHLLTLFQWPLRESWHTSPNFTFKEKGAKAAFSPFCVHTSARFPAGQLEGDASVELQADEPVGRHHDDAGDQEEQQHQGHVPARDQFRSINCCLNQHRGKYYNPLPSSLD